MLLEPIITSLLETDMYKFSMGQCIYHQFSDYKTTWSFKCRNTDVKIKKAEKVHAANGVLLFRFSTFACELSLKYNFIISFHKVFVNTILPVCVLLLHPPLHIDSFPVFLHRRNQRIHSKL